MGQTKAYDKTLHFRLREASVSVIANYLLSLGEYRFDIAPIDQNHKENVFYLINKTSGKQVWFAYERKLTWIKDGEWQGYDTMDIPIRKAALRVPVYIQVNHNLNTLALVSMKDVIESPTIKKNTKYTESEDFHAVPIEKVKIVSLSYKQISPEPPKVTQQQLFT